MREKERKNFSRNEERWRKRADDVAVDCDDGRKEVRRMKERMREKGERKKRKEKIHPLKTAIKIRDGFFCEKFLREKRKKD